MYVHYRKQSPPPAPGMPPKSGFCHHNRDSKIPIWVVTKRSTSGLLVVTKQSPSGHQVVTKQSPSGHLLLGPNGLQVVNQCYRLPLTGLNVSKALGTLIPISNQISAKIWQLRKFELFPYFRSQEDSYFLPYLTPVLFQNSPGQYHV